MDSDGQNEVRLTDSSAQDRWPTYSPDGQSLVFHSDRDGNWEIYMMNLDGTAQQNLTQNSANEYVDDWK